MTDPNVSHSNNKNNDSLSAISPQNIAIIGGGLSGLFTATLLEQAFAKTQNGLQITIFEKSRSVGRLATRYRTDKSTGKNWQWSFGAQFFTAKSESFKQFIAPDLHSGLLQPWLAKVVKITSASESGQSPQIEPKEQWDSIHARYISTPKMTSWGRKLADDLQFTTIKFKTRVAPLAQYLHLQTDKRTELFDENGESLGFFDWVICTAPNGQAAELMAESGFTQQGQILKPEMLACYTLMLGWQDDAKLPDSLKSQANEPVSNWDVTFIQGSILDRMFIEHHKPNHDQLLPSLTIHANNQWSQQQVDQDITKITAQLLAEAKQLLNWHEQTAPTQIDCHRWRYASTLMPLNVEGNEQPLGILVDKDKQWLVSGDWCAQGNIESCYQVAEQTAGVILEAISTN